MILSNVLCHGKCVFSLLCRDVPGFNWLLSITIGDFLSKTCKTIKMTTKIFPASLPGKNDIYKYPLLVIFCYTPGNGILLKHRQVISVK